MRLLRFLLLELGLRGVVFTVVGTMALVALYLLSIGAPPQAYSEAMQTFTYFITWSDEFTRIQTGFSAADIIVNGASITFPLAIGTLFYLTVIALGSAAVSSMTNLLARDHGHKFGLMVNRLIGFLASVLSALPLFVGFWFFAAIDAMNPPYIMIAFMIVGLGGLGWDASRFLIMDMKRQTETTHTLVYNTLGHPAGRVFPLPGTISGYVLKSAAPRFIPYVAGKVPAIIGAVTIAEMVFSFPGLGRTLLDALVSQQNDKVIVSVFVLLAVNAIVAFLVKSLLFVMYPRWYEKAI